MPRRRITHNEGINALNAYLLSGDSHTAEFVTAVRYLLEELSEVAPGNTVEVRVPPYGATQCIEGPRHTRGTPPNVVELRPEIWVELAIGKITWSEAQDRGFLNASGVRADLSTVIPLKLKGIN